MAGVADRQHPIQHLRLGQRPAGVADMLDRDLLDGVAIHIIHHQIEAAVLLENGVATHEIGMAGVEDEFSFQAKLPLRLRVAIESFLDGTPMAEHAIVGLVDVAEAAAANVALDEVTSAEECARWERGWLRRHWLLHAPRPPLVAWWQRAKRRVRSRSIHMAAEADKPRGEMGGTAWRGFT